MSDVEGLGILRDGGVLRLRLERPHRRNALTTNVILRMISQLEAASIDDGVRVIVIEAAGDHFCAGVDFERPDRGREGGLTAPRLTAMHRAIDRGPHRLVELLARIEVPVVAAVRGHASGLGCGLALTADLTIVSETAKFSAPFVKRGFTPDSGTSFLIPRLTGQARAKEMLLEGRVVDAREAAEWGLITRSVPDDQVEAQLERRVAALADAPTTVIGLTKWLLFNNTGDDIHAALNRESLVEDIATRTADFREGVAAFVAKRPPDFHGN
jgi:2-(1,2-epoxy-1,2-dihydrophenyl)acetyl-CoA isomerase